MLCLAIIFLLPVFVVCQIPELATMDNCMNRRISITDRNVRKAIQFFRGCRNLGLTLGDLLPEDYMKRLAEQLKMANFHFLRQTTITQPKLRMLVKEINDLYQEITILAEKVVAGCKSLQCEQPPTQCTTTCPTSTCPTTTCTTTTCPTTTCTTTCPTTTTTCPTTTCRTTTCRPSTCPTTCPTKTCPTTACSTTCSTTGCSNQEDSNKMVDPFDYDYGSAINPCSEEAFYIYLLLVSVLTLLVSLCTCRNSMKTYRFLIGY